MITKKEYTYGLQDMLRFGKYRGQILSDVLRRDAEYILWCLREISSFRMTEDAWDYASTINAKFNTTKPTQDTNSIDILDSFPWKDIAKARERYMSYARKCAIDVEILPNIVRPQAQQLSLF